MISQLIGTIAHKGPTFAVVNVNGVGYKVSMTQDVLDKVTLAASDGEGPLYTVLTYLAVREDALDLYGFLDREQLHFFELLITISGIGPKTALSILNVATLRTLRSAISLADPSHLTKISGIGKRNAEKIVMELKDKISGDASDESEAEAQDESDALEALKGLGYSERTSREALKKLGKEVVGTGEKVKRALKLLSK